MIKSQDVAVSEPRGISSAFVEWVHDGVSLVRVGQPETVAYFVHGYVEEFQIGA
jgi:hypothetical protein